MVRNPMNVVCVVNPLASRITLLSIREFILEKSRMNVRNVGNPSGSRHTLLNIGGSTQERDHMNVRNVGMSSDKVDNLLSIGKSMLHGHRRPPALPHSVCCWILWLQLLKGLGIHPCFSLLTALVQNTVISPGLFQVSKNWSFCISFVPLKVILHTTATGVFSKCKCSQMMLKPLL